MLTPRELRGFLQKKTTAWGNGPTRLNILQKGEARVILTLTIPDLALITQSLGPMFCSGAEKTSHHFPLKESGRKAVNSSFTCQTGVTWPNRVKRHYSFLLEIPHNSTLTIPAILKLGQ